jgi:Septum formation
MQIGAWSAGRSLPRLSRSVSGAGAPAGLHQPVAAAPAAGGPGSTIAPLAAGAPDGPRGQRTACYSRRKSLVVAGVVVVMLAAPITVIEVMNSSTPSTNRSTLSTDQLSADPLRTGDCLAGSNMDLPSSSPWPDYVTRVPCTKPHEAEVFFAGNVWPQSQAFPGKGAIDSRSDARCGEAFAAYDGIDASQSAFSYDAIIPDSSDWASGDRSLACVAWEPSSSGPSGGAPVNYSLKGSKK